VSSPYPIAVYRNKLLETKFYRSENKPPQNVIDENVEGDWLLYMYIVVLDEEIFSEMPVGLTPAGEAFWVKDRWDQLMPKIADQSRIHGWCVLQFYEDEDVPWRVFSVPDFADWIRETIKDKDGDDYVVRKGISFKWTDDLGNNGTEECVFADKDCYLIKYREGDGKLIFAYPDLTDAVLDIAYNNRQSKGQMDFIGAKPGYPHFKLGEDANDENTAKLDAVLKNVDKTAGISAPKGVLEEIETITDKTVEVVIPIYEKGLEAFAGITGLPVSKYTGKRDSGWSEAAEKVDLLKIDRKKNIIFKRYEPTYKDIFANHYTITIGILELPQDKTLESIEKDDGKPEAGNPKEEPKKETKEEDNNEEGT